MDALGFVFEPWLDTQLLTDHTAEKFDFEFEAACPFALLDDGKPPSSSSSSCARHRMKLSIEQGTFCHTKEDDRTGAVVWDDAVVMARHFAAETTPGWFRGKKCIELGSGCGFWE